MFLRGCLKQVDYLKHAHFKTINKIAYCMKYSRLQQGDKLFKQNDICDMLSIVVNGMVELHIEFDREKTVLERLGRGTVIN